MRQCPSRDQALEFKDRVGEGRSLNGMGVVYEAQGRYDEALDAYAQDLAICREFKDRVGEGRTLNNMGGVYRAQSRYDEALDAARPSLSAIQGEFKDMNRRGQTLNNMGGLCTRSRGRYDEASTPMPDLSRSAASSRTASARA